MTAVAFFRNLNQGQSGQLSAAQFLDAFEASGARAARPVRSNGTMIFESDDPDACLEAVLQRIRGLSAWADVAFVRSEAWLVDRACEFPPAAALELVELSLFDGEFAQALPLRGKGCTVVRAGRGYAITVNDTQGTSQATPTLERALGTSVTSRAASTVKLVLDAI